MNIWKGAGSFIDQSVHELARRIFLQMLYNGDVLISGKIGGRLFLDTKILISSKVLKTLLKFR